MLKNILLGALNYQPLTGYQMKQFIENSAGHFWYAQISQVYRTLGKLEDEGLVTSEVEEQESRPDKRIYSITEAGRQMLRQWLAKPMTHLTPSKDELLARLFFSAQLDKETILTQLRIQRSLYAEQLTVFQEVIPAQLAYSQQHQPERARDAILWDCARRNGELGVQVMLQWLDETIQRIETEFED